MKTLLGFFFSTMLAVAGDGNVTGKWTGTFRAANPDGSGPSAALFVLKQSGTQITGTVGPDMDHQSAISKGSIEGAKVTIHAEHEGNALKMELVLAADQLTGEAIVSHEGQSRTAKIAVTRAK